MNEGMPRKLPLYVCRQKDRQGHWIFYFRIGKGKRVRLPAPNDKKFKAAYEAALRGSPTPIPEKQSTGSIAWLMDRYMHSQAWKEIKPETRKQRSNIFYRIKEKELPDGRKVGALAYSSISAKSIKNGMEDRCDTPAAANNYLKSMSALCKWAVSEELMKENPAAGISKLKLEGEGFPAWDIEDVRAFCIKWPIGTRQRLALELALHTGLRRSDLVRIGRQHLKDNTAAITTAKTGARITVELPQRVLDIIAATKTGELHFLVTEYGKPFSVAGFGNWFGAAAQKAGVAKNTHGIRKLAATLAANGGATAHQLMSQFGWSNSKQAEVYTKGADRARLGVTSSRIVSEQLANELSPHTPNSRGEISEKTNETKR